jgi:hypothetical protein
MLAREICRILSRRLHGFLNFKIDESLPFLDGQKAFMTVRRVTPWRESGPLL